MCSTNLTNCTHFLLAFWNPAHVMLRCPGHHRQGRSPSLGLWEARALGAQVWTGRHWVFPSRFQTNTGFSPHYLDRMQAEPVPCARVRGQELITRLDLEVWVCHFRWCSGVLSIIWSTGEKWTYSSNFYVDLRGSGDRPKLGDLSWLVLLKAYLWVFSKEVAPWQEPHQVCLGFWEGCSDWQASGEHRGPGTSFCTPVCTSGPLV